ncbi:hypothetical protein F2P56_037245 [Juglans regia]|uniref:Retrovirus-related Pol polyprotein from transposon RE1 n=1 Tax=Juglans regia TaxID=51240 RepID=A0A833X5D8_JUGRE|nr:hypothetical protein F2P56_037245 [Juglans regia]
MVSGEPSSTENSIPQSENTHNPITTPPSSTEIPLIALNITSQINEKLTPFTFPQWRAQFEALLIGYNLIDYVTGDKPCPNLHDSSTSAHQRTHWIRQDKLILSAIMASTTTTITPFISIAKTSQEAWHKLHTMYASKSRTRAMQLKEELTLIKKGSQTIQEYLHTVKSLADEISLINHPISEDDLTLYILNGLGADFREIAAPIRARERPLTFEELHDLLVGHDAYLRHLEVSSQQLVASANYSNRRSGSSSSSGGHLSKGSSKSHSSDRNNGASQNANSLAQKTKPNGQRRYTPKCQLCEQLDHTVKYCPRLQFPGATANCISTSPAQETKWLIDSAASHNITGDLAKLSIHSEYDGTDEVVIGDGSGLPVSHIGSLVFHTPTRTFHLNDTLCVPNIKKNLISVHNFTTHNNVFVEFHPLFFLVKDQTTGTVLLKGACENGVYTLPESMPKSVPCLFVGYSLAQNAYKCIDPSTNKVYHSRHVLFDETRNGLSAHPSSSLSSASAAPIHGVSSCIPQPSPVISAGENSFASPPGNAAPSSSLNSQNFNYASSCPNSIASHVIEPQSSDSHEIPLAHNTDLSPGTAPTLCDSPAQQPTRIHSMTTRSMNNIHKPKQLHSTTNHPIPSTIEPTCVGQALREPHWRTAMSEELTALMRHSTWELVPPPNKAKHLFDQRRKINTTIGSKLLHFSSLLLV